jgi:AcrR family transcriptional regulator
VKAFWTVVLVVIGEIDGTLAAGEWRLPPDLGLSPILSGALDAFYEAGYHGTSVRDIARRVGLTVPALYYHHKNKEAILYTLLDTSITEVIRRCQQALDEAGPQAADRFLNLVECLVRYMASSEKSAAMDSEIRALSPENHRAYSRKRRSVERMLVDVIEEGAEAGIFDVEYPADTARALLGMIQAVAMWFKPGGRLSVETVARRYMDIAAQAVGSGPEVITVARAGG